MSYHIIYTQQEILLSKKHYSTWQEIQSEYVDFKTSLGPFEADEVTEYLQEEHPTLEPSAEAQMERFLASAGQACVLTFK